MPWDPYFRYYFHLWQTFLHLRLRTFDFFLNPSLKFFAISHNCIHFGPVCSERITELTVLPFLTWATSAGNKNYFRLNRYMGRSRREFTTKGQGRVRTRSVKVQIAQLTFIFSVLAAVLSILFSSLKIAPLSLPHFSHLRKVGIIRKIPTKVDV